MSDLKIPGADTTTPVASWRARLSRVRPLHLAPILAVVALGAWIFASPIGAAPDDDFHLTSTWCANDLRTDLCDPGTTDAQRVVPPALLGAICYAYDPEASASCQETSFALPSDPSVLTERGSFEQNYPPVYYAFMNIFAGHDLQLSALIMRLVNVLLFVGIVSVLYVLLPIARRASLLWGWIITMVPLGMFLIASNNPSAWAIIGVGSSWLALVGYFESTGRRRIGLGVVFGLTVIMAAGARGDGAVYSVIGIIVAMVLTFRRARAWVIPAILPAVMALVAVAFFYSSRQATVAVSGLDDGTTIHAPLDSFGLIAYNLLNVQSLWFGIIGGGGWGLGWLDTALPAVVSLCGVGVFVAIAFTGIRVHTWRKTLTIVGLSIVLWLLPTYVLYAGGNAVGANVQPRYLLPLIVLMGGLAVFSIGSARLSLGGFQQFFVILSLGMAESVALHFNIRRYVTGVDIQGWNLNADLEWWWSGLPLSPMAVWLVGSLAFTGLIYVLVRDLGKTRTDELTS
jgi:hypothetical protein